MSVSTKADECKEKAVESLADVIDDLEVMVNPKTWGNDEYSEKYMIIVESVLHDARRLRRELID